MSGDFFLYVHLTPMKRERGGYRKDGKQRKKITLSVTEESIQGAQRIDPNISHAFEKAFEPKPTEPCSE
jgi:hypothetical protein